MKIRMKDFTMLASLTLALGVGTLQAQSASDAASGATSTQASAQDKKFLMTATDGSLFEIKTSQLALQKSQNADIKQYAQQMIDDHTKLMDQMKPVASEAGVTPQTDLMMAKHKALYSKLQGMNEPQFDQAYIKAQLADHKESQKAFQTEQSKGTLASEKAAAAQGQPIIDQHLQHIQQLSQSQSGKASGKASGM